VIAYFIILPTVADIIQIHDAVYKERLDLETKYKRGQLLKQTIANFEKVKPVSEKISSAFIIKNNELDFITALEKIATADNVTQNVHLAPQPQKTSEGVSYFPLNLEIDVSGEYINILKYLNDLELQTYQINISSIVLTGNSKDNSIDGKITGQVYSLVNGLK